MNNDIKKIRILACIGLACVLFECIVGVGALFSGMMYRGFEKDKAVLKLELIKASDKELYERITGDKDSLEKADFNAQFQLRGKPILVTGGILILIFTLINAVPLALMAYITFAGQKKEQEDEAVPEKKGEEDQAGF